MWFKDDVRNILLGLDIANAHPIAYFNDAEVEAYRAGFRAAIIASAASFGIFIAENELRRLTATRALRSADGPKVIVQR
jgi:hypothetical protein